MPNIFCKIAEDKRGTALLVALLVMGVFTAISIILSTLIIRETRITKDLLDSGAAYYAAESAIEEALFELDNNLPGWDTNGAVEEMGISNRSNAEYQVWNKCNSYPCFNKEEFELGDDGSFGADGDEPPSKLLQEFYDVLDLNETVTIPLFVVDENEEIKTVEDFTVEFYTAFNPVEHLNVPLDIVAGWDVLRWKLFGMKEIEGSLKTDALHDFTAVSTLKVIGTDDDYALYADKPSWFGTQSCSQADQSQRLTTAIECVSYASQFNLEAEDGSKCDTTYARDYYLYGADDKFELKYPCYPIWDFMETHSSEETDATGLVYLTLTNLMNPAMLKSEVYPGPEERARASRIFFRVETYGDDTVREYATIVADGYSGGTKQSIEVKIKKDSYMPVFNFSLYSTYKNPNEKDKYPGDWEYYYDDEVPQLSS